MPEQKDIIGIPDKRYFGNALSIPEMQALSYILQSHTTSKSGRTHEDLRLGDNKGMYSWAVPKGLPIQAGEKRLAIQQPMHSPDYNDFEGTIPEGYGAGTVKKKDGGEVVVTRKTPHSVQFTVADRKGGKSYTLVKTGKGDEDKNWLLTNSTLSPDQTIAHGLYDKVHMKNDDPENIDKYTGGDYRVSAKVDGAAALQELMKDRIETLSYRKDVNGNPIQHTDRIGGLRQQIPDDLLGTVLRSEIYGEDKTGKAIPPQQLGGILNSTLANSIRSQQAKGINLKTSVLDLIAEKGKKTNLLPEDRQARIQEILKRLNNDRLTQPPSATDKEGILNLFNKVKNNELPITKEGVVAVPNDGSTPTKLKFTKDDDVVINKIFKADTKTGERAGGFEYGLPDSPNTTVGRVGTGFDHATLQDMLANPDKYLKRIARIKSQGQFDSGAHRAPSFIALHEG